MSEETAHEELPMDEQARRAFENATFGRNLCGMVLEKFTPLRKHTAAAMKMRAPNWSDADIDCLKLDALYPKALDDIAILFWVLTRKPWKEMDAAEQRTEWSLERANAEPGDAYLMAIEWADKLGLTDKKQKLGPAYRLLQAIMRDISISTFGIQAEGGTTEKKSEMTSLV